MITLDDLFQLQEDAAKWNMERSSDLAKALQFIRELVDLVTKSLESLGFGDEPAKQTVIRLLAVDSLSSLVIATRVALWGNVPESSVLIRTAIETLTVLECVVEENAFRAFDFEMRSKLRISNTTSAGSAWRWARSGADSKEHCPKLAATPRVCA